MLISHEHEFIYLQTPKTGSISLSAFFSENYGARNEISESHPLYAPIHKLQHQRGLGDYGHYTIVASIRNPFELMVSWYTYCRMYPKQWQHPICKMLTFTQYAYWVKEAGHVLRMTQTEFLKPLDEIDHWIRLESVRATLMQLPFVTDASPLRHVNTSTYEKPWLTYYTPDAVKHVREWAAEDFENFGYSTQLDLL